MPGEENLALLLQALAPQMDAGSYTFAMVEAADLARMGEPVCVFREVEGISVICLVEVARRLHLKHEGEFRMITLTVHSSLAAVGLTAYVSGALAKVGISCNVVAAFHHDHLFVPCARAEEALQILAGASSHE